MSKNNAAYWAKRYKQMEDALQDKSYEYVKNLEKQYNEAITELDTKIRAWYQRIANNNGISYSDAQKLLTADELEEFHWSVGEYIRRGRKFGIDGSWAKELENASARVHISRLESIKFQIREKIEELSGGTIKATQAAARSAFTESYYHTAYELQKGLGVGWTMQALDERRFEKVLSRPWTADGKSFTARCWEKKENFMNVVSRELTRMIATGEAPDRAIDAISKQLKVTKQNAGRLVMTESAFFASAAQKDCFNDLGVERYSVVATLDKSTCDICGDMDGKVFQMSKFEVGITAPPFHPWCRCCTAPYFEDMQGIGNRFARDVESNRRFTVPKEMTYEEWKAQQDAKYGEGFVDKERKKRYNYNKNKEQYSRYVKSLGNNAPKTIDDFQKIKYSDQYEFFKAYSKSIRTGELSPLADFELYLKMSSHIDSKIIGIKTQTGIIVAGKSYHFISRYIGSVEQRRNGVSFQDCIDALIEPEKVDDIVHNKNGDSQRFIGKNATVTINPSTGILIQTNPRHKK